jgi:hypothetical protein
MRFLMYPGNRPAGTGGNVLNHLPPRGARILKQFKWNCSHLVVKDLPALTFFDCYWCIQLSCCGLFANSLERILLLHKGERASVHLPASFLVVTVSFKLL